MCYFIDDPFCRLNLNMLALFGHMSYQSLFNRTIAVIIGTSILTTASFFQIAKLIESDLEMNIIVEIVPTVSVLLICLVYIPVAYINRKKYDRLLSSMREYVREERMEIERRIKKKYDNQCRLYVKAITIMAVMGSFAVAFLGFTSKILDIVIPINETRPPSLPFKGEHFVDEEEYFYPLLFFQWITIALVVGIIASIENMFIIAIHHVCGMFGILGYRLENICKGSHKFGSEDKVEYEKRIIDAIKMCVGEHQKAINFVAVVNSCADILVVLLLVTTVISFSTSMAEVINVQLINMKSVLFALAQIGQFYVVSHMGQLLINAGEQLPNKTYDAQWHDCPVNLQKLFVLLILRSYKSCMITANNMYIVSLENFCAVTQTAMSYCMVLRQFQ